MLDKLPQELIVAITDHLSMKEKLMLITTCRYLLNIISGTNLFSELNLMEYKEKTPDIIINKFKRYPTHGAQVKLLSLNVAYTCDQLSTIFPNVTQITTRGPNRHQIKPLTDYSNCSMVRWSETIKRYNSRTDWPETLPVLKTTPFPQLKELVLGRSNEFEDKNEGFDIPYLLPVFKNVPSLKKLTLWRTTVDLEFLDAIHVGCPLLESLTFIFSHIIIRNDKLAQPIISADSILHLRIHHAFCIDTNGLLLDYIASKYRNLKYLELSLEDKYNQREFIRAYDPTAVVASINRPKAEDMLVYNSLVNDFESTMAIYKSCAPRFFAQLTPTIEKVSIKNDVFDNTLEALSETNVSHLIYDIYHMKFENKLTDPKQFQHISHITSLKVLNISTMLSRSMNLQVFPSIGITKLTLVNREYSINIDWVLDTFPSLEELAISSNLAVSSKVSNNQFPNLRKFVGHIGTMEWLNYLKLTAPNIKVLELSTKEVTFTVDISGWELQKLKVILSEMEFNQSRYYRIRSPHVNQVISYNPREKRVVKEDAFADTQLVDIISMNDQHFLFYGSNISILQRKITIT